LTLRILSKSGSSGDRRAKRLYLFANPHVVGPPPVVRSRNVVNIGHDTTIDEDVTDVAAQSRQHRSGSALEFEQHAGGGGVDIHWLQQHRVRPAEDFGPETRRNGANDLGPRHREAGLRLEMVDRSGAGKPGNGVRQIVIDPLRHSERGLYAPRCDIRGADGLPCESGDGRRERCAPVTSS
jgi:hypothetical protein